ncbi:MAG: NAD(P)-dependent oxidoreductase, partial [Hyphomicrobiaceae bacterium]
MPLAKNLAQAGHDVVACDKSSDVVAGFSGIDNLTGCPSIGDMMGRVQAVFTCLPNEQSIRSVYLEQGGILDRASRSLITCDISTVSPDLARHLGSAVQSQGGLHFDTPVFGSPLDAEAADVFFAVSGPEAAVHRIEPFLSAMGRGYRYVGESGTASLMKILQN